MGTAKAEKKKEKKTKTKKDATAKGPKKPQSAYFLYLAWVRADIKTEFGISKASDVAREGGKKWKALGEAEKKPFVDEAAKLKEEWKVNVELFKAAQAKAETEESADTENVKEKAESENETVESTNSAEKTKEDESETEEPKAKGKKGKGKGRGRKRKHESASDELEPAQKKRKLSVEADEVEAVEEDGPMSVLANVTDLITGERVTKPAMSPYGHVMEYDSWCSILRNPKTKNKCPFTQKPMTRRQLIKLDEDNIEQYKEQIVNLTTDDMQKLSA